MALLIGLLLIAVVWAGGGTATADGPKVGGTLTIAANSSPVSLDPHLMRDWTTRQAVVYMYDSLVRIEEDETVVPALAESWDVSEDGRTYTFRLRRDVKFHDGTPFNAAAVKFNYDRMLDPAVNSNHLSVISPWIEAVEVLDEFTVEFRLTRPVAEFLGEMSWSGKMVSPAAVEKYGDDFHRHPVGTGPFKFQEYVPDSHLILVRNEDYWRGPPPLDRLHIRIIPEVSTRLIELEAGNVDVVYVVPAKDVAYLESLGFDVQKRVTAAYAMLALNLAEGPTVDPAVRHAIAMAIDRDLIIQEIMHGLAEKSRAGVPSPSPYYHDDVPTVDFDLEAANRLLDEAGWVMGSDGIRSKDGQPLALTVLTGSEEERVLISQIVVDMLRRIGARGTIVTMEWGAFLDAMRAGEYHVAYWTLGGFTLLDANGTVNMKSDTHWNVSQISRQPALAEVSRRVDEIIDTASGTVDNEARYAMMREFQELAYEHQFNVWLWHPIGVNVLNPAVKDYGLFNYNIIWFERAWLDR